MSSADVWSPILTDVIEWSESFDTNALASDYLRQIRVIQRDGKGAEAVALGEVADEKGGERALAGALRAVDVQHWGG